MVSFSQYSSFIISWYPWSEGKSEAGHKKALLLNFHHAGLLERDGDHIVDTKENVTPSNNGYL